MKIEMVDLHRQYERIKEEVNEQIQKVLNSCAFINGPQVKEFCENLAIYNNVKHVIPCANGTDALQIALMTLDLKPGDEVIVPVHTYVATAEVIALLQLTPVFVDCEDRFFSIDVAQIEDKITSKTKAIVPVHLYGQCADMDKLLSIAQKYHLYVIEDAAQAIGAEYHFPDGHSSMAGCMGNMGTTSFFPSKNLGGYGDGGAIFTNDDDLAQKAKMIANHGQRIKYHHDMIGCNSRLDTLQAAILNVKLRYLNDYKIARNSAADYYDHALNGIDGLILPHRKSNCTHVFHQYTIRVTNDRRDALKAFLQEEGIPSMIYYPIPLHQQKGYQKVNTASFPTAERLSREVLSIPIHTEMTKQQLEYITHTIRSFFETEFPNK